MLIWLTKPLSLGYVFRERGLFPPFMSINQPYLGDLLVLSIYIDHLLNGMIFLRG